MSWLFPRRFGRAQGATAVLLAMAVALAIAALGIVPVESQALSLEALRAPSAVPTDDPWDAVWDAAPRQDVPLSAQNIAPPFGGGTVGALVARALHDGDRIYLLLEWADPDAEDTVNGFEAFSDAAAVQFPAASIDGVPPFTMGGPSAPVNIWQWKAVWQADLDRGFDTSLTRYPDTVTDAVAEFSPDPEDTLYKPALHVGNPLAQRDHASPVESMIAEGFGTLTHADVQDVDGSGEWREGRWRALFARQIEPASDDQARFAVGETTNVAFAVWDGGSGDRNGQKSIAPFIDLTIGPGEATAGGDGLGGAQVLMALVIGLVVLAAAGSFLFAQSRQRRA